MKKYYMHCILCSARRTVLYIRDVCSTTCWNNLHFVGTFSKICGNLGEKKISKICWNNLQDLWECGREKKIPKICGRDFLAYTREKKSTRFVGEIFTRFSSLSPRKKNLQDLWDYFLGSKINKICGPHILLIFFLQEKWIYPQDSHISCPRNSKISLEELYQKNTHGLLKKINL